MVWRYCPKCLEKERRIAELEEENKRLKAKLRHQERTASGGYFGSSTPSSKVPIKPDALSERQARRGGAKKGHKGHGRQAISEEEADKVEKVLAEDVCPECGGRLERKGSRSRTVIDCVPLKVEKRVYHIERKWCPHCRRVIEARTPGVLPKSQYGNRLLTHIAIEHYVNGRTLGQIEAETGAGCGSLIDSMHQLAKRFGGIPERIIKGYRRSSVKHADETGWRTDGQNGYAWLFCANKTSIFRFRRSRSSAVPKKALGTKKLPGVLVVDRYGAYNKAPCAIQYCYAHLLRDVRDLEKDFPDNSEVKSFVESLAPLLAGAMNLRSLPVSKKEFKHRAAQIKRQILQVVKRQAKHPAIQYIQDIFRTHSDRMYHWARDQNIPADNNYAEREL